MTKNFFATAPKGMEPLLADELRMLGAENLKLTRAGVAFEGPLQLGYRVCLWSRIANRVLLPLESFDISTADDLYAGVQSVRWDEHLAPDGSLAVDFAGFHAAITHTHFGALKVKDAIVDQFRTRYGVRPSVELKQPDVRINLYLHKGRATVSLDLSGESLHRRGYRETGAPAPLKENLAAAILMKAGWPAIARAGGALIDPMCGSGTLPIEAALMAADIAPGLLHSRYGFLHWRQHSENIWTELLAEARERKIETLPPIIGYDADARAVHSALRNVELAGLQKHVHIERQALANLSPVHKAGLVAINPPYGERLGDIHELKPLYTLLGERLRERFQGWQAALLAGNSELGKQLGIRARRLSTLYNGALPCKLLCFDVDPQWFMRSLEKTAKPAPSSQSAELSSGAQMFANRLRKNLRSLKSWVKNEKVSCYRVYDADIPEYAVAVDKYEQWVHVQEYAAPASIDKEKARMHLQDVMTAIPRVLETQSVFLKVRLRQKGNAQYEKLASSGKFYEVHEGDAVFLVNFTDYLDTGLFLDQRLTRKLIRQHAEGKRFLNLFAYTGSATIAAILGGAAASISVDSSKTYLGWARRNLARNGFSKYKHEFIQADCLDWLAQNEQRFGLIFMDPPTFSNSKRTENHFDVQRDHTGLIRTAMNFLAPGGILIFSNNNRRFKINRDALADFKMEDLSRTTLPPDFKRNPKIHNCWKISL